MTEKLRASAFWVLTGQTDCWKCGTRTRVSAVILDGYEEEVDEGEWERRTDRTLLSYVEAIGAEAGARVEAIAPWLKIGRSETADVSYLANHCETCDILQGDWFLSKPGAVFFPDDEKQAEELRVDRVDRRIEVEASMAWSSWHDWLSLATAPR